VGIEQVAQDSSCVWPVVVTRWVDAGLVCRLHAAAEEDALGTAHRSEAGDEVPHGAAKGRVEQDVGATPGRAAEFRPCATDESAQRHKGAFGNLPGQGLHVGSVLAAARIAMWMNTGIFRLAHSFFRLSHLRVLGQSR